MRRGGIVVSSEGRGDGGEIAEGAILAGVQMFRLDRAGKGQI